MKKTPAAPKTIDMKRPLDEAEAAELVRCERLLDGPADTPVEAGKVLRRIRDGCLYRTRHDSFYAYCLDPWLISRNDADKYIEASLAAEKLSPTGDAPVNEAQTHLALLPPDDSKSQLQLLPDEASALSQHEAVIERGIKTFYEVGASLLHIRDERLYRETHDTFETYCRERWNMTRQYANKVIAATTVMGNLETRVSIPSPVAIAVPLPVMEAQVRPLAALAPEDQRTVWTKAVEESGGQQPTALKVSQVVHERIAERQREAGIVEPPPAKRPMSRKELRELRDHVYGFIEAIEKLAKPALPLDEVATEILEMNWSAADWVGQSDEALRNLQILVKELHKANLIPASTIDASEAGGAVGTWTNG